MFSSLISNKTRLAQFGLVFTTLAWGATFVLVKEGLNHAQPFTFGAYRFLIATICTAFLVRSQIFQLHKQELYSAVLCGVFLFTGYAFQNFGLWENEFYTSTTPSKSAFITSISIIMVPIMLVIAGIQKVSYRIWTAILLATIGLYLLLDPTGSGISLGDIFTFGCAICFAIHIILIDIFMKQFYSPFTFGFIQYAIVFLCSLIFALSLENPTIANIKIEWFELLYTGVFSAGIGYTLQIIAQSKASPAPAAIILSMESVFGALAGWILLNQILDANKILGCLAIFMGVIIVQLVPVYIKNKQYE